MRSDYHDVGRAYLLYREEHVRERERLAVPIQITGDGGTATRVEVPNPPI